MVNIGQTKRRILEKFPELQVRNERKPYGFSFDDSSGKRIMRELSKIIQGAIYDSRVLSAVKKNLSLIMNQ